MRGFMFSTVLTVLVTGCGTAYESAKHSAGPAGSGQNRPSGGEKLGLSMNADGSGSAGTRSEAVQKAPTADLKAASVPAADRKIIYVGEVRLIVEDFGQAQEKIPQLVQSLGGYLANVQIERAIGERRHGHWVARLPVQNYDAFLARLDEIGLAESRQQTAQDVTEEFIDVESRIRNSKQIEQRLLKLLEERTGEIKDVVEVETKLGQVRGEVEQMEGRLRYLINRTDLTTVTIRAREERDYVPPAPPTLGSRIARGWQNSLVALRQTAENVAVSLVIAAPWILVAAVIVGPVLWLLRRLWRSRRVRRAPPPKEHISS